MPKPGWYCLNLPRRVVYRRLAGMPPKLRPHPPASGGILVDLNYGILLYRALCIFYFNVLLPFPVLYHPSSSTHTLSPIYLFQAAMNLLYRWVSMARLSLFSTIWSALRLKGNKRKKKVIMSWLYRFSKIYSEKQKGGISGCRTNVRITERFFDNDDNLVVQHLKEKNIG